MMRPPPCLTIWRAAAWQQKKTPLRLTRSTRCHSTSGCSRNGAECAMPALANITSRRPSSLTTRSTKSRTWPASPTSMPTARARPPPATISLATASAPATSTSPRATVAPAAADQGVVEAVGDGVTEVRPGARVAAFTVKSYAEYCQAPASMVIPLPDVVSFVDGAAFPIQVLTAYHMLHTADSTGPGRTVLVHSAAGGVGLAAVQLARAAGARVP